MDKLGPNVANGGALTPLGFLERAATVYGDRPSVVYNSTVYTWSETHLRCLCLASSLSSLGISRGDVVSVVAPNVPAMYEMHFGVPMSGAVLNTINTRLDARTISVLLRHSGSKLIFVHPSSAAAVRSALSLLPSDHNRPLLIRIEDNSSSSMSPATVDGLTYEKLIRAGDPKFKWIRPETEWDPMVLNYTSGTTSAPKGVVHCHRALFLVTLDSIIDWPVPEQPVYLWTLPMFHANGWSFPWGMAAVGATNVCLSRFDATVIFSAILQHKVTHMCCAPVVLNMLANFPNPPPLTHSVNILTGGAPPPPVVLFRAEKLGFDIKHGYGLTETGGMVLTCAWKKKWDKLPHSERAKLKARQGVRTLAMSEIDVIDPSTGSSVPRDGCHVGEIVLRGGFVTMGYLKDPKATSSALRSEGWFCTGDVGVIHSDGYIEIKDRSKDVIISGGENISSVEVESVLYSHPAVGEAAVVARSDEHWGETPCAFIALKMGAKATEMEIMRFCREKMARYMVPKTVVFMADLPKTSTGKIKKYVLREKAKKMGSPQQTVALISRI